MELLSKLLKLNIQLSQLSSIWFILKTKIFWMNSAHQVNLKNSVKLVTLSSDLKNQVLVPSLVRDLKVMLVLLQLMKTLGMSGIWLDNQQKLLNIKLLNGEICGILHTLTWTTQMPTDKLNV